MYPKETKWLWEVSTQKTQCNILHPKLLNATSGRPTLKIDSFYFFKKIDNNIAVEATWGNRPYNFLAPIVPMESESMEQRITLSRRITPKGGITTTIKLAIKLTIKFKLLQLQQAAAIKHKTSHATLAHLLQPSLTLIGPNKCASLAYICFRPMFYCSCLL